jgi:DNA-binding NtrC family response regulator/ferredoxin
MISREEINKIPLLRGIPSESAAIFADRLRLRSFLPGEYVFLRGEPGHSMFVILEGKVAVTLTNAEGHDYTIATLQEGNFFGELGVLAGEPRSAHIKALTRLLAVEIDQEGYEHLERVFPELSTRLMEIFEKRVAKARLQWKGERVKSAKGVSRSLLPVREPMNEKCLPGVTKWAEDLNRLVEETASTDGPVLISGEPGTERVFIARLLISRSKANALPSISLNCSAPPAVSRENGPSALESAQKSALFGHEAGSTVYARGWRRGYLDIADTGTLVLDHVEDLTPRVQTLLVQYLQYSRFSRIGSKELRTSKVRIIATTTRDLKTMAEQGKFNKELLELLRGQAIRIIPLRERKEDIPALAQEFLVRYRRRNQEQIGRFSQRAMKALVSHEWPMNFAELNTVISRAVAVSQGKTVEEEHIFLDVRPTFQPPGGINLLNQPGIGPFLRHRLVAGPLQYVTVPLTLGLILYILFGPREQNPANIIAWSLICPSILLSIILIGRGLCASCPISAISNAFVYGRKKFLRFPAVIRKYGTWAGIGAFVSIFWIEHTTEAFLNAHVTGMVFLSITACAVVTALLFGKRMWCLYLCPMGKMLGDLGVLSIMELRANSRVCIWQCEFNVCIKDNNCPMGLHPSSERTRHDCILCFACADKCKQESLHLDLLLPHQRVLATKSSNPSRTAFVVLLTGSVLASQVLRWLGDHRSFTDLAIPEIHFHSRWEHFLAGIAVAIGFAAAAFLASKTRTRSAWSQDFSYAGRAYLPLAFFGLFDIYFSQFISRSNEIPILLARMFGFSNTINPPQAASIPFILQALPSALALAGGVASLYLLKKLRGQNHLHFRSYRLHQMLILITSLALLTVFWRL